MTHKLLSLRLISSWLAGWLALHSVSFGAVAVDPEFTVATFKDQDRTKGSATDDWLTTDTELGQSIDMRSRLGDLSWVCRGRHRTIECGGQEEGTCLEYVKLLRAINFLLLFLFDYIPVRVVLLLLHDRHFPLKSQFPLMEFLVAVVVVLCV